VNKNNDRIPVSVAMILGSEEERKAPPRISYFERERQVGALLSRPDAWLDCARNIISAKRLGDEPRYKENWELLDAATSRNSRKIAEFVCESLKGSTSERAQEALYALAACPEFPALGIILINTSSPDEKQKEFFTRLANTNLVQRGLSAKIKAAEEKGALPEYLGQLTVPVTMAAYARETYEAWKKMDPDELADRWAALCAARKGEPSNFTHLFSSTFDSGPTSRIRLQRLTKLAGWEEFDPGGEFTSHLPERIQDLLRKTKPPPED